MPTLPIVKTAATGQKAGYGQRRLSLPGVRVSVQPAAPVRRPPAAANYGYGIGLRRKSLTGGHAPRGLRPGRDYRPPQTPPAAAPASRYAPPLSPVAFAHDVLRVKLWAGQVEALEALAQRRRVAVKAGNGLGKGFCAAVALLWFIHAHPDAAIALSTAPTFRQVRHILWRQVHQLYRRAPRILGGRLLDTRWEITGDRYAMGLSADSADQFQGFHSPNMFIVVDEAEGVADEIYEAIEAVMTSAGSRLLLIGNPTTMSGAFRRAFHEERRIYHTITISALDSPNVQAGKPVIPGLATARWVDERREIWGEDSPVYRARVLGQFPDQGEDTLLRLSDLEAAAARHTSGAAPDANARGGDVVLAVDVARFGADRSVILRRRGDRVEDIRVLRQMDTMQLTGWIAAAIRESGAAQVCVDEIGLGAGVVDRLRELGHPVRGVNVAQKARQADQYANLRAEGYWNLRERFRAGRIAIPPDQELIGELSALRYYYSSNERIQMESKEQIRKRGLPSPDKADALMLAYLSPASRLRLWT